MNLNELVGLKNCNVDIVTGLELSHQEKYKKIVDALGFDNVKKCLPYDLDTLKKAVKKDKHLNNLSLKTWDRTTPALSNLYRSKGVTSWSLSQSVCVLKECARMWVEMEG